MPRPAIGGRRIALVESGRDSPSGQAIKLSQDRSQRLGPRLGCVAIGDALGVKAAQLDALSFLRRKRVLSAL